MAWRQWVLTFAQKNIPISIKGEVFLVRSWTYHNGKIWNSWQNHGAIKLRPKYLLSLHQTNIPLLQPPLLQVEFYVCPVFPRQKQNWSQSSDLELTSQQNYGADGHRQSTYNRQVCNHHRHHHDHDHHYDFQPGTFVPMVGQAGDSKTLSGHPRLPPSHCPSFPRVSQLQVGGLLL